MELRGGLSTTRDNTGNPTYWGDLDGIYTRAYTYDLNSRLATENYPGQPQITNTYDWVGNKTSLPGSAYNAADQLTTMTGHTYTYDGRGNMVTDNTTQYTYAPANLLSTAGGSSMTWDAEGNRITFTSSTDTSNPYTFVYDPTAGIPAIIEESHAGTSIYYVREPGGALIARVSGTDIKYYGFDDLGSTLFLTDSTGIVTDKYTYDAWGNSTSHEGSTQQPYQYVGRLGYYTHWQDVNFGLLQLGVREYNPSIGRFGQVDPVKHNSWSAYAFCYDQPVLFTDPDGKNPAAVVILAAIGIKCAQAACILKAYNEANKILQEGYNDCDKLGHCYFTCRATRCLLRQPSESVIVSLLSDTLHLGSNDFNDHAIYNHAGTLFGFGFGNCRSKCSEFWRQHHAGRSPGK